MAMMVVVMVRVIVAHCFFEHGEQLRIATVVREELQGVAIDEVILIVLVLLFELLHEEAQMSLRDLSNVFASINTRKPRHALSLPTTKSSVNASPDRKRRVLSLCDRPLHSNRSWDARDLVATRI